MVRQELWSFPKKANRSQIVKGGDIIDILPGVKHWHGASSDDTMMRSTMGIKTNKGIANWLEPVSDEQ